MKSRGGGCASDFIRNWLVEEDRRLTLMLNYHFAVLIKYVFSFPRSKEDTSKIGLLTVILSCIFMKGNIMKDSK